MNKRLLITAATLVALVAYSFWSNSNLEAQRQRMQRLRKGMSRTEIEALLSKPDEVYAKSGEEDSCLNLSYTTPTMTVTICHDSATSASFYEGKSEITIFE